MSDKPHECAVRSPDGFWLMVEHTVKDDGTWEVRLGPTEPWEEPCHSPNWVEARPSGGESS